MIEKILLKVSDHLEACFERAKEFHDNTPARYFIVGGVVAGLLTVGILALRFKRDYSERNVEIFWEMGYSYAGESQRPYDEEILDGGRVDQPAPVGTVYRGQQFAPIAKDKEGETVELNEAKALANPFASDSKETLERGKDLYRMNCQGCHNTEGQGGAPVTNYGIAAPSLTTQQIKDQTDGEIFYVITYGRNTMPAHADHVKVDDRWKLIRYLRKLQRGEK